MTQPAITLTGPDLRRIADVVLADLLPPQLRRKWLSRMGRMAIAQAKKNVREQKTVDGSPMAPRKHKEVRKKMLTGLVKSRWLGMDLPDENTARVKFFRNAGVVARKHQLGGRAAGVTRTGINYPTAFDTSKIPASLKGKHFTLESGKSSSIFLFFRKILSTSNRRIFRVSKGGAFSLLEKFSGRNWNFILPQKRV